ncbi:hypothetical protein FRB98_008354, partial [Tulasnella sp. 332]
MLSKELIEEATDICSSWSSSAHLEVEELRDLPLFHRALRSEGNDFSQATLEHFTRILRLLQGVGSPATSSAAIITKPPEILAVFAIATHQPPPDPPQVFIVFDSHSRPDHHPTGAAFSFFGTLETAAAYLSDLLSVDPDLLNDPRMQWQAQLMSQYSAHFFVARSAPEQLFPGEEKLPDPLYEANISVLELKSSLNETKASVTDLETRNLEVESENIRLKDELNELRRQFSLLSRELDAEKRMRVIRAQEQYSAKPANGPTRHKGKEKERVHDERGASASTHVIEEPGPVHWVDHQLSLPSIPNPLDYVPSSIKEVIIGPTPAEAQGQLRHGGDGGPSASSKLRKQFTSTPQRTVSHSSYSSAAQAAHDPLKNHQTSVHLSDYEVALALQTSTQSAILHDTQLAREMQRQFDEEADVLRTQHFSLLSLDQKRFDCKICLETLPEDVVAGLEGCEHLFCRQCLSEYVKTSLKDVKFPIVCPVCVSSSSPSNITNGSDANSENGGVVSHETFQMLGISDKQYARWVELELGKWSVLLDCNKCRKSVLVDKHDLTAATIISCPMGCTNMWCKKCSKPVDSPFESDHSCDGTVELEATIQAEGWKRCPTCKIPVERS